MVWLTSTNLSHLTSTGISRGSYFVVENVLPCISLSSMLCKSQNILLDEALQPKVADFGFLMALPLEHGSSCVVTGGGALALAGTRGYLAPEFTSGAKSDVYSYGIVSLQLKFFSYYYYYYCTGGIGDVHRAICIFRGKRRRESGKNNKFVDFCNAPCDNYRLITWRKPWHLQKTSAKLQTQRPLSTLTSTPLKFV